MPRALTFGLPVALVLWFVIVGGIAVALVFIDGDSKNENLAPYPYYNCDREAR